MFHLPSVRFLSVVTAIWMAIAGVPQTAFACDPPHCAWKTVTVDVDVDVPSTRQIVRYDHCGRRIVDVVEEIRIVSVPVVKRVRLCN